MQACHMVLIVEDEPLIRLLAIDIVEDAGYEVISASNADEAMILLNGRDDIGYLFTDIDMPGSMNGLGLATIVRDSWPAIHIIITSGQYDKADISLDHANLFLSKPYQSDDLINGLRSFA